MITEERVVLVNEGGDGIGAALKSEVHHTETPLHLAFSCYVFHEDGRRLLVTRRALSKRTWPGTWTNSFCGHPAPFEAIPDAVLRRAHDELTLSLGDLSLALPDYRYRAVDASGVVENEICPVYVATATSDIAPNPTEVMGAEWVDARDLAAVARRTPWALSPWAAEQLGQLAELPQLRALFHGSEPAR